MRRLFHSLLHLVPPLDQYVTTKLRAKFLRFRYAIDERRIRHKCKRGAKIRIVFLVNEPAKWKAQSLFDLLSADGRYEIMVALSIGDTDMVLSPKERLTKVSQMASWFTEQGVSNCVFAYDPKTDTPLSLDRFEPDMVFYQQPWFIPPCQMPRVVSKYALTFYIPYFVPTFANNTMHCQLQLHMDIFRHFVLNDDWRTFYLSQIEPSLYAGKLVAAGHPILDGIERKATPPSLSAYIIYAPHWSIYHPKNPNEINLSTFTELGFAMLDYAQRHPEIRWAFRPHPTLRLALIRTSIMSKEEIDSYYASWAKVGMVSLSGGYTELFNNSRALITDCDSFLSEYAVTGNPIIRLVSKVKNNRHFSPLKSLFDSYYQVHNKDELEQTLNEIIVKGNDPLRETRLAELNQAGLNNSNSAERIANHIHMIAKGLMA